MDTFQLESSLPVTEETRVKKKYHSQIKELSKKSHFNMRELEVLALIFHKIRREGTLRGSGITKVAFLEVLHNGFDMTDDVLIDRVLNAIETKVNSGQYISLETWIRALSLFLKGTLDEKIEHCFQVYSRDSGMLGRDNVFHLMKKSLVSSGSDDDAEEAAKDMIEVIIKKLDKDADGKISLNDFRSSVKNNPLLLECFGQCLPSRIAVHAFIATALHDAEKQI